MKKLTKAMALAVGPTHRSGLTIAEIANHAANYWKHQDEWRSEKKTKQQERTEAAIGSVGALPSDYPMTQVLTELTGDYDFKPLLHDLAAWHDELCRFRRKQSQLSQPTQRLTRGRSRFT
jgi:hypothetical protein